MKDRVRELARRLDKAGWELSHGQRGDVRELIKHLLADEPERCRPCDDDYERDRPAAKKLRGIPVCKACEGELRYEWAMEARDEDYVFGRGD